MPGGRRVQGLVDDRNATVGGNAGVSLGCPGGPTSHPPYASAARNTQRATAHAYARIAMRVY
eukprot:11194865-Lingulodinium_polyedra.AAC.1